MHRLVGLLLALILAFSALAQNGQNLPATVLPSLARTATTVLSPDQVNVQWTGATIIIDVSARTSGTYTPTIQGKDPASGNYFTLLVGSAISSTGTTALNVGKGLTAVANAAAGVPLPRTWRISLTGTATPSMTFSVGAVLTP